jgi:hypothetical protein
MLALHSDYLSLFILKVVPKGREPHSFYRVGRQQGCEYKWVIQDLKGRYWYNFCDRMLLFRSATASPRRGQ